MFDDGVIDAVRQSLGNHVDDGDPAIGAIALEVLSGLASVPERISTMLEDDLLVRSLVAVRAWRLCHGCVQQMPDVLRALRSLDYDPDATCVASCSLRVARAPFLKLALFRYHGLSMLNYVAAVEAFQAKLSELGAVPTLLSLADTHRADIELVLLVRSTR